MLGKHTATELHSNTGLDKRTEGCSSVVEYLPSMHPALGSVPSTTLGGGEEVGRLRSKVYKTSCALKLQSTSVSQQIKLTSVTPNVDCK